VSWSASVIRTVRAGLTVESSVFFANATTPADNFQESFRYTGNAFVLAQQCGQRIAAIGGTLDAITLEDGTIVPTDGPVTVPPGLRALIQSVSAAESAYEASNWTSCAAALNAKTQTTTQLKPLTVQNVFGCITQPATLAAVWDSAHPTTIRNDIRAQDREALGLWAALGLAAGKVTQGEHDAVLALCAATESVPASPAEVQYGLGATITAAQCRAA
jgi:hypothetical protein